MKEVTKDQALQAIEILEKYKAQGLKHAGEIEKNKDVRRVDVLRLGTRTVNSLEDGGINTVGELLDLGRRDLRKFRGMGNKGIIAINEALELMGVDKKFLKTN